MSHDTPHPRSTSMSSRVRSAADLDPRARTDERRLQLDGDELEQLTRVGTWELDVVTGRTWLSPLTRALYGLPPGSAERHVSEDLRFFPAEARAMLTPALEALTTTGSPFDLELPLTPAAGPARWVRATGRAKLRDGRVVRVYGTFQDLTEQRSRLTELAEAHELLQEAQRIARLGHWVLDLDTGEVRWSETLHALLGTDPAAGPVPAATLLARVVEADRDRVGRAWTSEPPVDRYELTYALRRPDGTECVLQESARTEVDPGRGRRQVGTVQDVTASRRAEQALRRSEDRLQRVLRATNDGWWDHDLRTDETFHSDRYHEIHGYRPGELPEGPSLWRDLTLPADLARMDAVVRDTMAARAPTFTVTGHIRHRDGHLVPILGRGFIEYDDAGTPVRMSGSTTDMSEVARAETAKEAFLSTVSHELRTPLTSIGGALELLAAGAAGPLPATTDELVAVARRNTDRLRGLIDDLLDLEQLRDPAAGLNPTSAPLGDLVARTVADTGPYAQAHEVAFAYQPPAHDPVVHLDLARVSQVLANLLSNAAKYAPAGSTVDVRLQPTADQVRVEVVDRGPGVPEAFADRVFERFAQADPADPRSRGGTGLGLAISREIVTRLGGEVGYDSQPGWTRFWFTLPTVDGPVGR